MKSHGSDDLNQGRGRASWLPGGRVLRAEGLVRTELHIIQGQEGRCGGGSREQGGGQGGPGDHDMACILPRAEWEHPPLF